MKSINYYGTILTDKYYFLPEPGDHLSLPLIKTPVVISDKSVIVNWTFSTQRDAFIESCGCPKCKSDTLASTLSPAKPTVTNWRCVICGYDWKAYRGICIKPQAISQGQQLAQLVLFG